MWLEYQERVAESLAQSSSCLAVFGRGLGAHAVLLELARRCIADGGSDRQHAARLALLLNTPGEEAELLQKEAEEDARWEQSRARLIAVGPEMGVEDRAEAFAKGGVFVVSARLLVPDMLAGRLVPEAINGIFMNHAHSVGELSAEAFVLRIYRRANERGFVRAVTDRPDLLARDPGHTDKIMQRCCANHLEVWPRIRQDVQLCLTEAHQPEVFQRTLKLPPRVLDIQRHLLNIVEGTLEELRKDPRVDLGQLSARDSLLQTFDSELRQILDPLWQTLGPRTRRMVQDLGSIRKLLAALLQTDAVQFHGLLESVCAAEGERNARDAPGWLISPDARALQMLAKARVYEVQSGPNNSVVQLQRRLEPHAKWQVLLEIIERTVNEVAAAEPRCSGELEQHTPQADRRQMARRMQENLPPAAGEPGAAAKPGSDVEEKKPHVGRIDLNSDSDSDVEVTLAATPSEPKAKRRRFASGVLAASSTKDEEPSAEILEPPMPKAKEEPAMETLDPLAPGTEKTPSSELLEPSVLVIVPDEALQQHISSILQRGPRATLLDGFCSYLRAHLKRWPGRCHQQTEARHFNHFHSAGGPLPPAEAARLAKELQVVEHEMEELVPDSVLQVRRLRDGRFCHPRVDVMATEGAASGALERRLQEVQPHAVLIYEPNLEAIRILETFCAARGRRLQQAPAAAAAASKKLKVHILVFEDSVEKYRFQQALVQESFAVDMLIRNRRSHTTKVDSFAVNPGRAEAEAAPRSTRRGGGRGLEEVVQNRVVVDMREFRSALPFMLYLRDMTVEPVTIPVGDYVLSRDICVERKAIPDLVQSLASGRLYQQAQGLCQHYANPTLLIEFDPGKSFALQNTYTIARREVEVGARDLLGKLCLLVLHFPKLRLIWSPSQRYSADVFLALKKGRYQPDGKAAAQIDAGDYAPPEEAEGDAPGKRKGGQSNTQALDVLRKLPGVTPRNLYTLARRAGSLAGLAAMSEESLAEIMGKVSAHQLRSFLDEETVAHTLLAQTEDAAADAAPGPAHGGKEEDVVISGGTPAEEKAAATGEPVEEEQVGGEAVPAADTSA